ncbi:MAG TPA: glutaredoxin family protein [Spirochaetales bacterium]|nr:glutaredoxin family protein [Spirochaetales bacterium]
MKKVSMYTLSTCPWCRKTKKFFTEKGIDFDYIDYDLADDETKDKIDRDMDAHHAHAFPFVRIGDDYVEGYRPEKYSELLGL